MGPGAVSGMKMVRSCPGTHEGAPREGRGSSSWEPEWQEDDLLVLEWPRSAASAGSAHTMAGPGRLATALCALVQTFCKARIDEKDLKGPDP